MLNEERIIEAFSNMEDAKVEQIKYLDDKQFWIVNVIAETGFSIGELYRFAEELELNPDMIFIDKDLTKTFRISIFEDE